MDTYSWFRELADSWVLLMMVIFYVGAIAWAFRPGSRQVHADIAEIPMKYDELPGDDVRPAPTTLRAMENA